MQKFSVLLAALVVGGGLVAALPAGATGGPAVETPESHDAPGIEERTPPKLPEQWRQTYGAGGDDIFADLVQTDDGGYLLVGWTGENRDGWIVKVNRTGEKQWEQSLGDAGTDRFWGVVRSGEGYLLAGRTDTDDGPKGWVVRLGPDGNVRENRTLVSGAFYAVESRETDVGTEYLLAGWTRGDGGRDGVAVKLAGNLSTAWTQSYAAPEGYSDGYLRAVVPANGTNGTDGDAAGYYLAGKIEGDSDDGWALRIGADGTTQWQATAGGPSRDDVWAAAPAGNATEADSGFVMAGETESDSTGPRDGWLVKFGADGQKDWERKPGGEGTQWLDSAMRTDDGFLFTGGSTGGSMGGIDGYVLATDAEGEERWTAYYGTDGWDKPWPAIEAHGSSTESPSYVLAGQTSGSGAEGKDGWLLQIGAAGDASETTAASDGGASEDGTGDGDADSTGDDTTGEAMQGETATATADTDGGIPGFGVGIALVALAGFAALLFAVRR